MYYKEVYRIFELVLDEYAPLALNDGYMAAIKRTVTRSGAEPYNEGNNSKLFIKVPGNVSISNILDDVVQEINRLNAQLKE